MILDMTLIARRCMALLPAWARVTLIGSAIAGECLRSVVTLFRPALDKDLDGVVNVRDFPVYGWWFLGILICFPSVWFFRFLRRLFQPRLSPYERAEEYIAIIKLALRESGLSRAEAQFQWRSVLEGLAKSFALDSELTNAETWKPEKGTLLADEQERDVREIET
jgi:hypothetical protein